MVSLLSTRYVRGHFRIQAWSLPKTFLVLAVIAITALIVEMFMQLTSVKPSRNVTETVYALGGLVKYLPPTSNTYNMTYKEKDRSSSVIMSGYNSPSKTDSVSPAVNNNVKQLFEQQPLVIWSMDHHPAPVIDARFLLQPLGVKFLLNDMSPYCSHFNLCEERKKIKVINADNMFDLDPVLIPKFYDAYRDDPVMKSVDAFICYDPPAICELYEPFNKSLIIIASTRYYVTRQTEERWSRWNSNLARYAADPKNFIGANNLYDVNFMLYFTGFQPEYMPSFADYTETTYKPTRRGYLLAKRRVDMDFQQWFVDRFDEARRLANGSQDIAHLYQLHLQYPSYEYSDIAAHQGVVHLPYQVSTMSIFEHYRMNIPLFFPSKSLLLKWNVERWILRERTFPWLVRDPRPHSRPPHPSQRHIPSPNDNDDIEAMKYWMQFADYFTLPHITYFESVEHLVALFRDLTTERLLSISRKMQRYNAQARRELLQKWSQVLLNVAYYSPNSPH